MSEKNERLQEIAFEKFLESEDYEKLEQELLCFARKAFLSGIKWKKEKTLAPLFQLFQYTNPDCIQRQNPES